MTNEADQSRQLPTDAAHRLGGEVVESMGVEPMADSTRRPVATDPSKPTNEPSQRPRQHGSLPPGAILHLDATVQDENRVLRKAAAEALLAGGLLFAEVEGGKTAWQSGDKPNCVRLMKALEGLREALS